MRISTFWLFAALTACGGGSPAPASTPEPAPAEAPAAAPADPIAASVANPARPADDRARDADRKPAEVMAFFGIAPGMTVADLMAGQGYYTELLAGVVGKDGRVYAQNNAWVVQRFVDPALRDRLARPGMENVVRLDRELEDPGLPAGQLDVALLVLFYHDTYWQKLDRAAMNRAVFEALKPGGVFGVVDHHAEAGSGDRDVKTLHRVDAELVKQEILAAGFELADESELLRHPDDDRTLNVFDAKVRGKTDRFIYKFRRPK